MGQVLVVVSEREDAAGLPDVMVTTSQGYIEAAGAVEPGTLVVNLCRTVGYGSDGYYVSLLADARGQQVLPTLETSAGVGDPYARFRALQEAGIHTLDQAQMAVRRRSVGVDGPDDDDGFGAPPLVLDGGTCRAAGDDEFVDITACFGRTAEERFAALADAIHGVWPAPLLRIRLVHEDGQWKVAALAHASPEGLGEAERGLLAESLAGDLAVRRRGRQRDTVRASIAVLLDPADPFAASSPETVDRLEQVAAGMNVHVARIDLTDLRRLPEYDALFIRSLTGVKEPSFQFALRAESLDMPVLDDSQSIIRCSNKVFMEELLRREGVPLPRTRIVTTHTSWAQMEDMGVPFVLKSPDGSFSAGVHRISDEAEFEARTRELLRQSPLLIAQEWLPTDYDWRITVLDGKLLFAARYYMAQGHWQIRTEEGGVERYGKVEAVPRAQAPRAVVDVALRAARLIGSGIYGVDLKETDRGPVVIEVNDNPNLDTGYEDTVEGDVIYREIIEYFLRLIEESSATTTSPKRARRPAATSPSRRGGKGITASRPRDRSGAAKKGSRPPWHLFEVAGLELEYPTVNAELDVVPLVEPAFRAIAGRGTSDIELERVGFSNEIADHVFEVKTLEPVRTLAEAEDAIVAGVRRFSDVLRGEWDARLLPTGMHPWFDPQQARLWTRSGLRIYATYAQIFDIRTHGWMNVHATHLNLPFGDERETMAMHTAAALLLPYLPAVAASTPVHDGRLQPHADARLAWILQHQSRIPATCGSLVPEFVDSYGAYRREILQPMYAALDAFPHSAPIRHEFLNSRGAVLRFARKALELRVLDTQECVKMDVAITVFARAALEALTTDVLAGRVEVPAHHVLVADFEACIRDGSQAEVMAPHLVDGSGGVVGGGGGGAPVRAVLERLLERTHAVVAQEEAAYLSLVAGIVENGTLAERIRSRLEPHAASETSLRTALREVYGELAECLVTNEPWTGRGAQAGHGAGVAVGQV
ncbi:MAG TPA: glutamate-cysteine ligase family protein [Longimicrobiales bacterium]|nr:glutamate-cysteine ligase family protein [Longimicrobiales bacterium]